MNRLRLFTATAMFLSLQFGFLASTANAQAPQAVRKPSVMIMEIKDIARTGQSSAFAAMVQTAVTSSGKFRVIQSDLSNVVTQQQEENSGLRRGRTPGRVGGFESADYQISGSITAGGTSTQSDQGANIMNSAITRGLGGFGFGALAGGLQNGNCAKAVAKLAIDVDITDAHTGEAVFAKQINAQSQGKTTCTGDPNLDVAALLRSAANEAAAGLLTTVFPIKIADVAPDGTILLNYGEGTLKAGDILAIYVKGRAIRDPDTGAIISEESSSLGTILVTEVTVRYSKARAQADLVGQPQIGMIVRAYTPPPPPQKKRR